MDNDPFVNRLRETSALNALKAHQGLAIVYGRRRVGKTRLLRRWIEHAKGHYSQAIEGASSLQLAQIILDLRAVLPPDITPKNWTELFALIDLYPKPLTLCLDEFPYLVSGDASLPSILQKWWDHKKKRDVTLILCGSSQRMMHRISLDASAPLYGRSNIILPVKAMTYGDFCAAKGREKNRSESFVLFSLVGGIPKYWEFVQRAMHGIQLAEKMFFGFAAYMENEPRRLLLDEQIAGMTPLSVLEAIGRGAERPMEISSRLGVPQTQLSKVLFQLIDAEIIRRDVPFGQSERNPKNVLYRIADPSIRFWFHVYSPHQSRWPTYSDDQKNTLLWGHASTVFEDVCRVLAPGGKRYWEKNLELDVVHPIAGKSKEVRIIEAKFTKLKTNEKESIKQDLTAQWNRSRLASNYSLAHADVLDLTALARL